MQRSGGPNALEHEALDHSVNGRAGVWRSGAASALNLIMLTIYIVILRIVILRIVILRIVILWLDRMIQPPSLSSSGLTGGSRKGGAIYERLVSGLPDQVGQ